VELVDDEDARTRAGVSGLRESWLPVCLFPDGTRLECPTMRQITEHLGWFREPSRQEYDLAILGRGRRGSAPRFMGRRLA
jgi:thioredoxin reductase (NADPH)